MCLFACFIQAPLPHLLPKLIFLSRLPKLIFLSRLPPLLNRAVAHIKAQTSYTETLSCALVNNRVSVYAFYNSRTHSHTQKEHMRAVSEYLNFSCVPSEVRCGSLIRVIYPCPWRILLFAAGVGFCHT